MSEILKPCPFCGGKSVGHGQFSGGLMMVRCIKCDSSGPSFDIPEIGPVMPTIFKAREAWNRRDESSLLSLKTEMEAMAKVLSDLVNGLVTDDEEGLIEHVPQVAVARSFLAAYRNREGNGNG